MRSNEPKLEFWGFFWGLVETGLNMIHGAEHYMVLLFSGSQSWMSEAVYCLFTTTTKFNFSQVFFLHPVQQRWRNFPIKGCLNFYEFI